MSLINGKLSEYAVLLQIDILRFQMNDTAYFYEVFYIGKQHCSKNIYFILDMVGIFDYVVLCLIPMILENNKIQLYRKYRAFV